MCHYIIHGKAIPEKGRAKCGDFILFQKIKDDDTIILTLSDGVGSKHYDAEASNTACHAFIDSYINNRSGDASTRFEFAMKEADKAVSNPVAFTYKGMMSTMVAVVWNTKYNFILWESIGDSRLYEYSSKGLTQISRDSKKAVNMRDGSGKLLIQDGVLVIREGLTNALGYNGAKVSVNKKDFMPGESLILCSDGMYSIEDFESSLTSLLSTNISENKLEKFFAKNKEYFNDDASMLILQRIDQPSFFEEEYRKIVNNGFEFKQNGVMEHLLTNYLQTELLEHIKNKKQEDVKKIISYIEKFNLHLTEDFILEAIQTMKTRGFAVDELYQLLIRQLRVIKW